MSGAPLHFAGERLMLVPEGALFWPAQSLLVVADLHFEKGSAAALRGQLVPPWDTRLTLDLLAALLRRFAPRRVIALGDSFHDSAAATRLLTSDSARLATLTRASAFTWVLGNHDPAAQAAMLGTVVAECRIGPLVFRHQAEPGARGEISGHFHPKATIPVRGTSVSRPCFVADAHRLLLPALGAYTGGLDVGAPAIARLFPRGGRLWLLGRERLFSFPLPTRRLAKPASAPYPLASGPPLDE